VEYIVLLLILSRDIVNDISLKKKIANMHNCKRRSLLSYVIS